jgi:hypothetical protein
VPFCLVLNGAISTMECNRPRGIKLKVRGCKLRGVHWYGPFKQNGIKQMGVKQGICVLEY